MYIICHDVIVANSIGSNFVEGQKRMLQRLEASEPYQANLKSTHDISAQRPSPELRDGTPRKKARSRALEEAKDLNSARERLFVVGRATWPTAEDHAPGFRQENAD